MPCSSRTLSSDNHRNLHQTASSSSTASTTSETIFEKEVFNLAHVAVDGTVPVSESSSTPSSRITKALLSRQALFAQSGPMTHSPHCVHGALMRTASTNFSCPVHGSQAHLCSSEARVLSRANKILMYVLLLLPYPIFKLTTQSCANTTPQRWLALTLLNSVSTFLYFQAQVGLLQNPFGTFLVNRETRAIGEWPTRDERTQWFIHMHSLFLADFSLFFILFILVLIVFVSATLLNALLNHLRKYPNTVGNSAGGWPIALFLVLIRISKCYCIEEWMTLAKWVHIWGVTGIVDFFLVWLTV